MGIKSSREAVSGTMTSAIVPALPGVRRPSPIRKRRKLRVTCPQGKKSGDTITIVIVAETKSRDEVNHCYVHCRFMNTVEGEWKKVIASTLHAVPGTTLVQSKPIIWSNASYAHHDYEISEITLKQNVGAMLERAQTELLERALFNECNAVLGIKIDIKLDTSGGKKITIASMSGTPCVVVSNVYVPKASWT